MKRLFDFISASVGLLLLLPFLIMAAMLIKAHDGGPVFFRQERVGRRGRPFKIFKFRSMIVNADKKGAALTVGADHRITPIGHFLRKYKLDEFPQLLNVFKGEMSLVGPRPEVANYVSLYTKEQEKVLDLLPGITDPASFAFYEESTLLAQAPDAEKFYREYLMPEKIRINLEYAAKANLFTDIFLVIATVARPLGVNLDIFRRLGLEGPKAVAP